MKTTSMFTATVILLAMASSAMAIGFKATVDTKNDTFIQEGSGRITAWQTTAAGAAHQNVGLRVRAVMPDIGPLNYTSRNNTYRQKGRILGIQNTMGGASFQSVGLEVY